MLVPAVATAALIATLWDECGVAGRAQLSVDSLVELGRKTEPVRAGGDRWNLSIHYRRVFLDIARRTQAVCSSSVCDSPCHRSRMPTLICRSSEPGRKRFVVGVFNHPSSLPHGGWSAWSSAKWATGCE